MFEYIFLGDSHGAGHGAGGGDDDEDVTILKDSNKKLIG